MSTTPTSPQLTAFDLGCVVVGGIIGVGIFFTPATVARAVDTSDQLILVWCLGGVLAVLGALVFAELAGRVPGFGGIFRYIHAAFGPALAWLYGWANCMAIQAGACAVIALVLVSNLQIALFGGQRFDHVTVTALGVGAILLFTITNVIGLKVGKRVQNLLTIAKIAGIFFLVALSWVAAPELPPPPEPTGRPLSTVLGAAILPVLFAIGGWQQGSFLAGAARHARSVPIGILGGVAVVIVTYLTINLAYLDLLGLQAARSSNAIAADAAQAGLGAAGGRVLAGIVVVSAAGILNTICLAPPYVLYAMAQERLFPPSFAVLHARFRTPVAGVLLQGLWAAALLLGVQVYAGLAEKSAVDTLGALCDGVVFVDWFFLGLCGLALLRLRVRDGAAKGFRAPGSMVVAALFALAGAGVMLGAISQQPVPSLVGAAVVGIGLAVRAVILRGVRA